MNKFNHNPAHVRVIAKTGKLLFGICFLFWMAGPSPGKELDAKELEAWFEDDASTSLPHKEVNEGELVFLAKSPDPNVLYAMNRIELTEDSLSRGWAKIAHCYENLDAVYSSEIVYRYRQLKDLRLIESTNIGEAWIEGQSVQLKDTKKGARVCVTGEANMVRANPDGTYSLQSGPYMRKYLDGYFPMHVSVEIVYPEASLQLIELKPDGLSGAGALETKGRLEIDVWFEGVLLIEARFVERHY
jgi:hypothetical protein